MENCTERKNMSRFLAEDKDKITLSFSLALGIILGSVTCAAYGSDSVSSGTVYEYCTNPTGTAMHLAAVTVGFILILSILGAFHITRLRAIAGKSGNGSVLCRADRAALCRDKLSAGGVCG